MRYGRSDIDDEYFAIIKAEIEDFVDNPDKEKDKEATPFR